MSEECRRAFQASVELIEEKCGVSVEGGNECKTAFKAALELMEEKCGVTLEAGKAVKLEELSATVKVPEEVHKLATANPELTREERIKAVSESEWARGWGRGMCSLVAPDLTGKEREECIGRLARTVAEKVV